MRTTAPPPTRILSVLSAVVVVLGLAVATSAPASADTAPAEPSTPVTVSADALPTAQVNGVAWTQVVVGGTVFVGGSFTSARPPGAAPGTSESPRANLMAYDLATGALLSSFAPSLNGQVLELAASPDGSRLYVAGEFTQVNGQPRYRIAAFDIATGALSTTFRPALDYRARALVVTSSTVYVGGAFNSASGTTRTRLAAFSSSTGSVLPWAPTAEGGQVLSMVMAPGGSAIVIGGQFTTVNGTAAYGMARLDATSGAMQPWAATSVVRNAGPNTGIYSLTADSSQVYGTGYTFGSGGNLEGSFAADGTTGAIAWVNGCRGDTYSAAPVGGVLYTVSHAHDCSMIGGLPQTNPWTYQRAMASTTTPAGDGRVNLSGSFSGRPASELLHWLPTLDIGDFTGQSQAAWDVVTAGDFVLLSGEFLRVNGTPQQGLVRFTTRATAPNTEGPNGYAELTPTLAGTGPGTVKVSWTAAWDRDNRRLSYEVIRDGTVVGRVAANSTWWSRPSMAYTDTTGSPGSVAGYRVRVSDALGNRMSSEVVGASVPAGTAPVGLGYSDLVTADGASSYWRLGETSGSGASNWTGPDNLAVAASATRGVTGALSGDTDRATTFSGGTGSSAATTTSRAGMQTFSVEAWFRTTSTAGGKIIGWGSSATGGSGTADRHVYMTNSGQLVFGVNPGGVRTVISPARYNDGAWHHVVATLGSAGMTLWVDGAAVGSRTDTRSAQVFNGYWRVGGDTVGSSWPSRPSSSYFAGSVDEVAVYPAVMDAATVGRHLALGRGVVPNAAPTAAFTSTAAGLVATFDGRSSADTDGSVVAHAWSFGDGGTGVGATPSHAYAASGTYLVTLTVTDDDGATGAVSRSITVTAPPPNVAPSASFTNTSIGLAVSVNGSGSADPDGVVSGYSWAFGDGTGGSGASASHTYAAAGTYTVTLTVTDDDGATGTASQSVTVADVPGGTPFASDAFGRTASSGFGAADLGGTWTTSGGASSFSVVGGTGRIALPTAGATRTAVLAEVARTSSDVSASVSLDTAQTGGGTYVSVIGRRVGTSDYRARVRYLATGGVTLQLGRSVGGADTVLTQANVAGLAPAPGSVVNVRLQVTGTGTTTLAAKVWAAGTAEPSAWSLTATDTTTALQAAGGVGVAAYLSGSSTTPMTLSVDDFAARPA